jgi:hypothetical protein
VPFVESPVEFWLAKLHQLIFLPLFKQTIFGQQPLTRLAPAVVPILHKMKALASLSPIQHQGEPSTLSFIHHTERTADS